MEIVKKAIDLYYSEKLDPHAVLAAWVLRDRPPRAVIEKAAKEINQALYTEEVLRRGNLDVNIPLINIDKVMKLIESYENSNPRSEPLPEIDLVSTPSAIGELVSNGRMELWLNDMLKQADDRPKSSPEALREKVINLLKTTYTEEYRKIKDHLVNTILDLEDFTEKVASAMVNDTVYLNVAPQSFFPILDHYIKNPGIKSLILQKYNEGLSKHASIDSSEMISGDRVIDVIDKMSTIYYLKSDNRTRHLDHTTISIPVLYTLFSEMGCEDMLDTSEIKPIKKEKSDEIELEVKIPIPKSPGDLINYLLSFDVAESIDYKPILQSIIDLAKLKMLLGVLDESE